MYYLLTVHALPKGYMHIKLLQYSLFMSDTEKILSRHTNQHENSVTIQF